MGGMCENVEVWTVCPGHTEPKSLNVEARLIEIRSDRDHDGWSESGEWGNVQSDKAKGSALSIAPSIIYHLLLVS